jgi:hypothetical protein
MGLELTVLSVPRRRMGPKPKSGRILYRDPSFWQGRLSQQHLGAAAGETYEDFGDARENGEGFGHSDALGAGYAVFCVPVTAGEEDQSDHEAHEKQGEVGEVG